VAAWVGVRLAWRGSEGWLQLVGGLLFLFRTSATDEFLPISLGREFKQVTVQPFIQKATSAAR